MVSVAADEAAALPAAPSLWPMRLCVSDPDLSVEGKTGEFAHKRRLRAELTIRGKISRFEMQIGSG